ncbi:MAG: chemotaxis protein CheW [Bacteroidales bacterium]|nr:chemotaxis protein CheW [Bacteroidales bacterium]
MRKNDQEILQERAQKISGLRTEKELIEETILAVEFLLLPETYAIDSAFVSEVLPLRNLTVIPGTPPFIIGVINVRGKIISVVNFKNLFNLKEKGVSALNKIIIIKHQQMEFGILTDEITGTKQLDMNSLSSPPVTLHGAGVDYIQGITPHGIIVLNAMYILTGNAIIVNQK